MRQTPLISATTLQSVPKITGGPKEAPVTKAKKSVKPEMDNDKNVRSLLVMVTGEVRDTFCFDIKKLNRDSYLESLLRS